jgi:hypothetical protein
VFSFASVWKAYGLDTLHQPLPAKPFQIISNEDHSSLTISTFWILSSSPNSPIPLSLPCHVSYSFSSDHSITLTYRIDLPSHSPSPPRIGLRTSLPSSLSEVSWCGEGPYEAYDDRKSGVALGHYSCETVSELSPHYIVPQECGRRHDPRYGFLSLFLTLPFFLSR